MMYEYHPRTSPYVGKLGIKTYLVNLSPLSRETDYVVNVVETLEKKATAT